MEYIELVIQAFTAALSWFTDIIMADTYLFDVYFTLCFISILIGLFVTPFLGSIRGSGSDMVKYSREQMHLYKTGKGKTVVDSGSFDRYE